FSPKTCRSFCSTRPPPATDELAADSGVSHEGRLVSRVLAATPRRLPGRPMLAPAPRRRMPVWPSLPRVASRHWLARLFTLAPRVLLHNRPSESPAPRPKAASRDSLPKRQVDPLRLP